MVCEFWKEGRWVIPDRWNSTMVRIMDFLNGNFALNENKPDSIEGKLNKKGNFDVKSVMRSLILP